MILLEQVQKLYHTKHGDITAVQDVNLEIHQGEIFGIIGYSGAGKSSLLRMLNQLEKPTAGRVSVAGRVISAIKGKELRIARREIGMIFQHFNLLWSRTVRENISFPLEIAGIKKEEREQRVNKLVQLVGLEGREDAYPSELSGGQKQRVGIARAVANNPKVLLCDEATSALDPETTDQILNLLQDINKRLGLTIVLITHEMHVIQKICNRVAVMEKGKIVEIGDVLDVFRNPQQEITENFVKQIANTADAEQTIDELVKKYPTGVVIQLHFNQDTVKQPFITELIRSTVIDVNILQGKISSTSNGSYGNLIIHLNGPSIEIEKAIAFIKQEKIEMEVIAHA